MKYKKLDEKSQEVIDKARNLSADPENVKSMGQAK